MKKTIQIIVACICISMLGMPRNTFAAGTNVFVDVSRSDWFYDEVYEVYEMGLMNGVGNSTFQPQGVMTRGMIVTILHRLSGETQSVFPCEFTDVTPDSYYENAIGWASNVGVVYGYSATRFGPDDPLTREQIATILYRYAAINHYQTTYSANLSGYSDHLKISAYAMEAMVWANGAKLINGTPERTLNPQGTATRAEVAAILYRFCENIVLEEGDADSEDGIEEYKGDNIFVLQQKHSEDRKTVLVTLQLLGDVELCGFDMRLTYNTEMFELQELDVTHDLSIVAGKKNGLVSFNYSAAQNVIGQKMLLTAKFRVIEEKTAKEGFELTPVEVIKADAENQYDIVAASYSIVNHTQKTAP